MSFEWPHKWFGFWQEMPGYEECPSIKRFINRSAPVLDSRALEYLRKGKPFLAMSAMGFPHAVTGELRSGSLTFLTDGVWVWPSDLHDYVLEYSVQIPQEFLGHMKRIDYIVPELGEIDTRTLEMP